MGCDCLRGTIVEAENPAHLLCSIISWEDAISLTKMAPTDDEAAALTLLRAEMAADGAVEAGLSEAERLVLRLSEVDGLQRKLQVDGRVRG